MQRVMGNAARLVLRRASNYNIITSPAPPTIIPFRRFTADTNPPPPISSSAPSSSTPSAPPSDQPPPTENDLDGGRVLGRLSRMATTLKHTLENEEIGQYQLPLLSIELDQEIEEAFSIIRSSLNEIGRPCSVEELGDRINENIIPFPPNALTYKNYLRATDLRDSMEDYLAKMEVYPPKESFLDGHGKLFCRLERRELRKQIEQEQFQQSQGRIVSSSSNIEEKDGVDGEYDDMDSIQKLLLQQQQQQQTNIQLQKEELELPELRPISPEELEKRKKYLEDMTSISTVLRGFDTALLQVGRVHKVVKEGTTMRMRALVVIGNRKGTAGYGEGKSETAQHAIERACRDAKRNLLHLDLYQGRSIYHRVRGKFIRCQVSLWPKPRGSGITGNNNYAAIFQLFGISDVGAKQHGSRNLINAVKALFNALSQLETPQSICESRGLSYLPRAPRLTRKPNYRPL